MIDSDRELCSIHKSTYAYENNKRFNVHGSTAPQEECKKQTQNVNLISRYVIFHLPLFLTRMVWTRHEYSLKDVELTLSKFKSSYHLWCLALTEDLSVANSAVKPSYATETGVVYGGQAIVRKNLARHIGSLSSSSSSSFASQSVLTFPKDPHRPPLPVHALDPNSFQTLAREISPICSGERSYSKFNMWKGIRVIPFEYITNSSGQYVLMRRVVPKTIFDHIFGPPACYTEQPTYVTIGGSELFAIVEEAFYFKQQQQQQQTK